MKALLLLLGLLIIGCENKQEVDYSGWDKLWSEIEKGKKEIYVDYTIIVPPNGKIVAPKGTIITFERLGLIYQRSIKKHIKISDIAYPEWWGAAKP